MLPSEFWPHSHRTLHPETLLIKHDEQAGNDDVVGGRENRYLMRSYAHEYRINMLRASIRFDIVILFIKRQ